MKPDFCKGKYLLGEGGRLVEFPLRQMKPSFLLQVLLSHFEDFAAFSAAQVSPGSEEGWPVGLIYNKSENHNFIFPSFN